ncbi:endonuclease/exonuclease/phosphatase family protein [Nonomuraea pusilla]|uniref:Metal-dependent hydrolase, endonuclease/exonuclease/phosphatase family n=1 Tax=Nonomuraea pusilla TaxID=46177 RepID=A0A1H7S3R6_9ACTN|nr:endonuclease/exonuclease/phosphatase family protein [Nonomuraea pusilla]SEL67008.1 Metal-dependent hydrolase, endonuclease/exonuclease/phosphatase family [Nonomuraea pusilla]
MTIPRGHAVMLAIGVMLLLDVLRVFLPSLITLFGRAGETPPELMGLYAAAWFVLPFLALLVKPGRALAAGAAGLVLARLLLQAGVAQLHVAAAGVSAGLVLLYGCARTLPRAAVLPGLMGGLAASSAVHFLLDGVDLVWRDGPLPWLGALALCGAFLLQVRPGDARDLAPSSAWFLAGPVTMLVCMASTGWTKPAEGPAGAWEGVLGVGLVLLALTAATALSAGPGQPRVLHTAWSVLTVVFAVLFTLPSWSGNGSVAAMLILGTGSVLPAAARPAARPGSARRPGLAVLCGMLVFLVAVFLYYAAYDTDLGFPNGLVVIGVAVLVTGTSLAAALRRGVPPAAPPGRRPWRLPAAALAVSALAAGLAYRPAPPVRAASGDTIRLITYNIRMGFGLDGRLSLDAIASWAAAQRPDVVLLSEVDRGWLLNGGHDDLARIARGLGMRYHFAPAADSLWGDALLTDLPVKSVHSHELGRHGYPTGAQAQAIVLDVGGRELGIVNTHLQSPPGQAAEAAAIARGLAAGLPAEQADRPDEAAPGARRRPVLLAGDLNTRPGDPEMAVLESAGLRDPLVALGDPPTSPADAPSERIDHVLIGEGLTAVSAQAPRLPYSDHLPVLTTLRLTSLDQEG